MKIKDSDLKNILAEVEAEVGELIKAEKARLAKSDEGSPEGSAPSEETPGEGSAGGGEPSAGGPPMDASASGAPAPSAPPAAPGAPGAPPDASGAPADPAAAGMDAGAPPTLEELTGEYAKLPPEELKLHYLAAKTALFQAYGAGDQGAAGAAPSPAPAGAAPAPGGASAPGGAGGDVPPAPPMMGKGEMPHAGDIPGDDSHTSDSDPTPSGTGMTKPVITNKGGDKGGKVEKGAMPYGSKKEGDDSRAHDSDPKPSGTGQTKPLITQKSEDLLVELDNLRKGQAEMLKILEAVVGQPERKAFTGTEIQYIKKSEPVVQKANKPLRKSLEEFTVADVNARLNEVTRNPSLKKSDRERINQFYANQIGLEDIKDLLVDVQ